MAGKYAVVMNGRKREVNASVPGNNGVNYSVNVREAAGAYEDIRKYRNGLVECLRETELESTGDAVFSSSPMEDTYYFVYAEDSGINGERKQPVSISLKEGEVSLHFTSGISRRRDEAELLANACIILNRVVSYVEQANR